ncbi:MAG TPA: DUF5615 family PIN-like protein [Longimicrobium sp.]|nr:DUF5615 family PIN-like protein [Longimicrobium sp.]
MKLLFDQNLSPRLVRLLADVYPGCSHTHRLGMDEAEDVEIWDFAAAEGWTVVSKDADFAQRSMRFGAPPKVIWMLWATAQLRIPPRSCVNATSSSSGSMKMTTPHC